jgi:hypothetical protein
VLASGAEARLGIKESIPNLANTIAAQEGKASLQYLDYLGRTVPWWRTAEEALARMASNDPIMAGLIITTTVGDARRNPLVKIAADAADDMLRFAGEFGLTPICARRARRRRLGAAKGRWEIRRFSRVRKGRRSPRARRVNSGDFHDLARQKNSPGG